jgi:hypothetical protein
MNRDYPPKNPKTVGRSGPRVRAYPPKIGRQPGATGARSYPARTVGKRPHADEPSIAKKTLGGDHPSADIATSSAEAAALTAAEKMAGVNALSNSFTSPKRRAALRRVAQQALAKGAAGQPGGARGNKPRHPKRAHLKPSDATSGRL